MLIDNVKTKPLILMWAKMWEFAEMKTRVCYSRQMEPAMENFDPRSHAATLKKDLILRGATECVS